MHDLHGIFLKLARLDIFETPVEDVYGAGFADFWTHYAGDDLSDIPVYERLIEGADARVLDLACGSGRIGIGLARRGYRVDGLELSPSMLALVEHNLAAEAAQVGERLRFFQGDICDFTLPERYDLIILGATTLCLLREPQQRLALFRHVWRHLAVGGRFVFDILDFSGDRWKKFDDFWDVLSREDEHGQEFAILGQKVFPDTRSFSMNVYRERIAWSGDTVRSLASSTKAWMVGDEVTAELHASGLQVTERFEHADSDYFVCHQSPEEMT